ncbi:MAG: DUF58 domain-containing protein [Candidatus Wallbacteria bacterium]|nr:DUF58 domain-containing protein [Candidatus Wallbacteria bacterium]
MSAATSGGARALRGRGTREGIYFLLLWVCIIVAAINSGTNLVYLFASVMAAIYALAFVFNTLSLKGLSVSVHLDREASEGDEFTWEAIVTNDGPFSRHFIEVKPKFVPASQHEPGRKFRRLFPKVSELLPYLSRTLNQIVTRLPITTRLLRRGDYRLENVDVYTSFPMRSAHLAWTYWPAGRVVVMPTLLRPFYTAATAAEIEVPTESLVDSHRGEGLDYHGLREYIQGDPPKSIHWKVSARAQRLIVREHQQNRSARYYLFLDLDERKLDRGAALDNNLEQCIRIAATVCRELVTANCHSQVLLLADEFAPSPSIFTASELPQLLRYLGAVPYTRRGSLAGMLGRTERLLAPDSYVLFVLPGATEEDCGAMASLLGKGYRVSVLLTVADRTEAVTARSRPAIGKLAAGGCQVLLHSRATNALC